MLEDQRIREKERERGVVAGRGGGGDDDCWRVDGDGDGEDEEIVCAELGEAGGCEKSQGTGARRDVGNFKRQDKKKRECNSTRVSGMSGGANGIEN
jgi:hypothetical protein